MKSALQQSHRNHLTRSSRQRVLRKNGLQLLWILCSQVQLEGIDSWTRWVEACPIPRKGGQRSIEHCVEGLVQMSCQLGYQQVTTKGDNESTMKPLKKSFRQLRGTLGLRTLIEDSLPHDHASNGLV